MTNGAPGPARVCHRCSCVVLWQRGFWIDEHLYCYPCAGEELNEPALEERVKAAPDGGLLPPLH